MSDAYRDAARWAAVFVRAAGEELGELASGEDYPVTASACSQHGPRCVCVTYGMFREHLRWRAADARAQARRAVATMLPEAPAPTGATLG